jgi:hypothetical protein
MTEAEFPFSEDEWTRVRLAANDVVNATLQDDDALRASNFLSLREVLATLRSVHGEHPVLLETEADFCDDCHEQERLYESAIQLAVKCGLPSYTARISYAALLLDELLRPAEARTQLTACADDVANRADETERTQWTELMARCQTHHAR